MSDKDKVKQLRQSTGAGFKDCSSALNESNGDIQNACQFSKSKIISKNQNITNKYNLRKKIVLLNVIKYLLQILIITI